MAEQRFYSYTENEYLKELEKKFEGLSKEEVIKYYGFSTDDIDFDGLIVGEKGDKIKQELFNLKSEDDIKKYDGLGLMCLDCFKVIIPTNQPPVCECGCKDIENFSAVIIELDRRFYA